MSTEVLNHETYMARAVALALRGLNTTTPNPRVGCVLVKGSQIVGQGYHLCAGEPHAEVNAIADAKGEAYGATAYVTLEPCNHQGRTGPCSQALVDAGVKGVVFGMQDPNPKVSGSGLETLRNAGVEVIGPVLESEARALNPGFIKRMKAGLPFVRVKLAMSLDGRTAMANGQSQWITGGHARQDVQRLRARACAIVTGVNTVIDDDPALTVRDPDLGANPRQPLRIILDSRLRTPQGAQILVGSETVIATTAFVQPGRFPVPVWTLPGCNGSVDLHALLQRLGQEQCNEVMIEAGPTLAGAFVKEGLVDELVLYAAPKFLGCTARPLLELPLSDLKDAVEWRIQSCTSVGADLKMVLVPADSI